MASQKKLNKREFSFSAESSSAYQNVPSLLSKSRVHYLAHKSPQSNSILMETNPVQNLTT
jgi:hypothetical protein